MISLSTKKINLVLVVLFWTVTAWAQQQTPLDIALRYVEQTHQQWQLDKTDVTNMLVSDQYQSRHNGVTHLYFMQQHAGIPVHNAILSVHLTAAGKVGFANSRFVPNLANVVNTTAPIITPLQSIVWAARQLDLPGKAAPIYLDKTEKNELIFEDKGISRSPIKVRLMYQPTPEGVVRLAWDMAIRQTNTDDYWSVRVDASTGALLDKNNWTVYCKFDAEPNHQHKEACRDEVEPLSFTNTRQALLQQNAAPNLDNAQYNVFPVPAESPIHGQQQLILNPADPLGSPFGWHDTNGIVGEEYAFTRGNNVHAFLDLDDQDVSSEDEPSGGDNLSFNFPFDYTKEPDKLRDASVTQLFYMNNIMHDFTYHYGFDEVAGNFQQNNYGKGGDGQDYVLAQSQDGGGDNNANFSTPPDGINSAMQMYLWSGSQAVLFIVNSPASIADTFPIGGASFGLQYSPTPISGKLVSALDSTQQATLFCGGVRNRSAITGNIAVIDRGTCTFVEKARKAQAAGAIGVLICNNENATIAMGGSATDITIPVVSLSSSNCMLIREKLKTEEVRITIQYPGRTIPAKLDASFDNGIVAHEYGHGISTRLTGGPANSDCLNNNEQMGEGWSDFFALATTVKPGEVGTRARGIGTYVTDRFIQGRGIRRFPYSTDMSANPQVFDDIIGTTSPHSLGEIWAGSLWDLYWKMVDVYGWDEDLYTGTGGNNLAIQLVMDGMKLQACNPGFIDGRDAILAADILNNDGANQCLIWEVFARRGLGWSAKQGDNSNRNDGTQAFDKAPECTKKLALSKKMTPLIKAGEEITVTLEVTNYKGEAVTEVEVVDQLPDGATYIPGSANAPAQVTNGSIRFKVDQLQPEESKILNYRVSTSTTNYSKRQFLDDIENGGNNWITDTIVGSDIWRVTPQKAFSGTRSWYVPATVRRNDQTLRLAKAILVSGTQPVLRFYHNYNTNPGLDGGIVQISTNGGTSWQNVDSTLFRNGYRGRIAAATFSTNRLQAYWGNNTTFVDSYLDLQPFIGQEIMIRFRFGTQVKDRGAGAGWWIDDLEVFDMYNYQSEACAFSKEGDQVCAFAESRGTIVQPQVGTTGTDDPLQTALQFALYPNPAKDLVNVAIVSEQAEAATLRIFSSDGRVLVQQTAELLTGSQTIPLTISDLSAGFYLVEVKTNHSVLTKKMIVK